MREDRPWGRATLIWLLLAALVAPSAMLALGGFGTRQAADPGRPARDAAIEASSQPLVEDARAAAEVSGLLSELAALRIAVEGERARLGTYRQAHEELTATVAGLRQEVAGLERRRADLLGSDAETGAEAPSAEAAMGGPAGAPAEADLPSPPEAPAGGGSGGPGQAVVAAAGGGPRAQGDADPEMPGVVIRHRAGSAAARRAAQLVADEVRSAGFAEVELRTVRQVPRVRTLRYFRDEDAPTGEMVADRLRSRWNHGWTVEARSRAGERQEVLEIWLPH